MKSPEEVSKRIAPVAKLRVGDPSQQIAAASTGAASAPTPTSPPATADAGPVSGETVYQQACAACHIAGAAGAPKFGDKDAWSARLALGDDALYASVINGKGAMPARAGNPTLTDEQLKAAVNYMTAAVK